MSYEHSDQTPVVGQEARIMSHKISKGTVEMGNIEQVFFNYTVKLKILRDV